MRASRTTWEWFAIALIVGLIFFFCYGFKHSNPDEIEPVIEPEGIAEFR